MAWRRGGAITVPLNREDLFARPAAKVTLFCHMASVLPYKISVLVFIENAAGEQLLMLRAKQPNLGVTGLVVTPDQLHLFAMIAEKAYQGDTHWLMFLFRCRKPIAALPPDIAEGKFAFFSREQIKDLPIPETDKAALWPIFDQYRDSFVSLKADCARSPIKITVEQITGGR
jgi:8-oxo-dGTP diphosphatase